MSLGKKYEDQVRLFVNVCGKLASRVYVTAYGGNLAWKLDKDVILITPTQCYKGDVGPEEVVFIDMDGNTIEGKRKPTGEKPMYLKFFLERPDIVSVLHCHPPFVCAMAILKGTNWLERPFYPETVTEVGPVPLVPYAEPLTLQLAENFAPYLNRYNSFIMENHGLVTMSRGDIGWTWMNIELLESTAQSILFALGAGELKELTKAAVQNLENVMKTRDLPLFGAPGVNNSLVDLYFGSSDV